MNELTPRGPGDADANGYPGEITEAVRFDIFCTKVTERAAAFTPSNGRWIGEKKFDKRFLSAIRRDSDNWCWHWTGSKNNSGYGSFSAEGKQQGAHRWAYEFWNGSIPSGMTIDHLCRNRLCVNPRHLEAVTNSENNRRGNSRSALFARATHCPMKHIYNEKNTYLWRGKRRCRKCQVLATTRYRKEKRRLISRGDAQPEASSPF